MATASETNMAKKTLLLWAETHGEKHPSETSANVKKTKLFTLNNFGLVDSEHNIFSSFYDKRDPYEGFQGEKWVFVRAYESSIAVRYSEFWPALKKCAWVGHVTETA